MEVVGRHAMLFDDDAASAFVNSRDALVEWNSLLIDRYDVRHLLSSPPPPPLVKRRRHSSNSEEESELDQIRFLDLPPPSNHEDNGQPTTLPLQENGGAQAADGNTYRAVSFSYGNTDVSFESKNSDDPGFVPPFSVPESLALPHTEKLHQIMARTAIFVSEHGGQSEIVLRVKQGNNPTFGFLMPDHHLHAYFRFLVDHPEVLKSDNNKPEESQKADQEKKQTGAEEALSLLGSVYGTGEDEDDAVQIASASTCNEPGDTFVSTSDTVVHGSRQAVSSGYSAGPDLTGPKHSHPVDKEKGSLSKKIHSAGTLTTSTVLGNKKQENVLESLPSSLHKLRASASPSASTIEPLILEPPSDMKRMMDKIIEFILKNGKDFEAVLIEQDRTNGRFSFLLPSNQYHPYYLRSLREAQEPKQSGRSFTARKEKDTISNGQDLPYDPERKEKFKMVITGSKKDAPDPAPKPMTTQQQCGMSVDAVAAVVQAATRGLRNPNLDIPMKSSLGDSNPASSSGTPSLSSQMRSSTSKPTDDVSVAKAIAKTAAFAVASKADSSEVTLTKEEKQKAERLKRAKMFAAIIKSNELLPRLSAEPPASVEREGSCIPDRREKCKKTESEERSWSKSHHSRSRRVEVDEEEERNPKHSRRKHHSHHSSRKRRSSKDRESRRRHLHHSCSEDDDHHKRRRHSSPKERESRHRHKHHSSSEDDERRRHSSPKERRSRHRQKHHSSSEDDERRKDRESRHRHKHHSSSEDHESRSYKHRVSVSHLETKVEESKDESNNTGRSGKSAASTETCLDLTNDCLEGSTPLVEVEPSDDLRAKVRAMLLATM